jgi:hypothetical protein
MSIMWEINYFFTISKHHVEPRLFFCLMHMFELFEFEFGACLNLNPKEKTKGKGIRKIRIGEKGKEAQNPPHPSLSTHSAQLAARARPRSLTGGSHLLALCLARSLSPSLPSGATPSAPWPVARSRACDTVSRTLLASPSLLLQPLARTVYAHAHRDRSAHVASQRETAVSIPPSCPCTHPLLPCLTHFASMHSHELCAAVLQARWSSPVTRPPAPDSAPSKAHLLFLTVVRRHQTMFCHRLRLTRGEFPRRTSPSLSLVFFVPLISRR